MNSNNIKDLGYGFILGDSLDVNQYFSNIDHDLNWESNWGNNIITPELIREIKSRGFRTIKVPITWEDHMKYSDDYKSVECEKWWIDRCKEVVQYILDEDLYCIINIHHDADWLYTMDENNKDLIIEKYKTLWKYIATEFKDFDKNKLFYENMNETGWESNTFHNYNQLFGQMFIDIVRDIDGDSTRLLFIEGIYADVKTTYEEFWNVEDDNYVVAVHFYTPYEFTIPDSKFGKIYEERRIKNITTDEDGNLLPDIDIERIYRTYGDIYKFTKDKYGGTVIYNEYDHSIVEERLSLINSIQEKYNCKCAITEFGINPKYRDKDHVYDWIKQVTVFCENNNIPLLIWNNGNNHQCILRDEGMIDRDNVEMMKIVSFYNHIVFGDELPDEYKAEDCI